MGSRIVNESAGTIQNAVCLVINGVVSCDALNGIEVTFRITGTGNYDIVW